VPREKENKDSSTNQQTDHNGDKIKGGYKLKALKGGSRIQVALQKKKTQEMDREKSTPPAHVKTKAVVSGRKKKDVP